MRTERLVAVVAGLAAVLAAGVLVGVLLVGDEPGAGDAAGSVATPATAAQPSGTPAEGLAAPPASPEPAAGTAPSTTEPSSPSPTSGPTATSPTPVAAAVEAGGTRAGAALVLTYREGLDLDSVADDWGRAGPGPTGTDLFFVDRRGGGQATLSSPTVVVDGAPRVGACLDPAAEPSPPVVPLAASVGRSYCLRTTEDRYAWVTVTGYDEAARTLTVDILVWRTPAG